MRRPPVVEAGAATGRCARRATERAPVAPERRSFAEAAAVVAAGHRKRTEPVGTRSGRRAARQPAATAPCTCAAGANARPRRPPPMRSRRRMRGVENLGDTDAAADDRLESTTRTSRRPTGPLIAPSHGTEEIVRGEDHRNVIDERPHDGAKDRPHFERPNHDRSHADRGRAGPPARRAIAPRDPPGSPAGCGSRSRRPQRARAAKAEPQRPAPIGTPDAARRSTDEPAPESTG